MLAHLSERLNELGYGRTRYPRYLRIHVFSEGFGTVDNLVEVIYSPILVDAVLAEP